MNTNDPKTRALMEQLCIRSYPADDGDTVLVIGTCEDIRQESDYVEVEFVFSETLGLKHIGTLNTRTDVFINDVEAAEKYYGARESSEG
jgi:hypothetical protein